MALQAVGPVLQWRVQAAFARLLSFPRSGPLPPPEAQLRGARAAGRERAASAAILEQAGPERVGAARRVPRSRGDGTRRGEGPRWPGPLSGAERRGRHSLPAGPGVSANQEYQVALLWS